MFSLVYSNWAGPPQRRSCSQKKSAPAKRVGERRNLRPRTFSLVHASAQNRTHDQTGRDPPKRVAEETVEPITVSGSEETPGRRQQRCLVLVWAQATGPGSSQPSP